MFMSPENEIQIFISGEMSIFDPTVCVAETTLNAILMENEEIEPLLIALERHL